ncbi:MAG: hypothetical protein WC297_03775 [Candidatus Paceibacterota bacterium]|jgi:hypothetical protein
MIELNEIFNNWTLMTESIVWGAVVWAFIIGFLAALFDRFLP